MSTLLSIRGLVLRYENTIKELDKVRVQLDVLRNDYLELESRIPVHPTSSPHAACSNGGSPSSGPSAAANSVYPNATSGSSMGSSAALFPGCSNAPQTEAAGPACWRPQPSLDWRSRRTNSELNGSGPGDLPRLLADERVLPASTPVGLAQDYSHLDANATSVVAAAEKVCSTTRARFEASLERLDQQLGTQAAQRPSEISPSPEALMKGIHEKMLPLSEVEAAIRAHHFEAEDDLRWALSRLDSIMVDRDRYVRVNTANLQSFLTDYLINKFSPFPGLLAELQKVIPALPISTPSTATHEAKSAIMRVYESDNDYDSLVDDNQEEEQLITEFQLRFTLPWDAPFGEMMDARGVGSWCGRRYYARVYST